MSGAPMSSQQSSSSSTGLSGLVSALDNTKFMRVGENSHPEYDWNHNDKQEQLVQIYFQCVRSNDFASNYNLTTRFIQWVSDVLTPAFYSGQTTPDRRKAALALALHGYKMIAQLRDVEKGKGECRLAYDFLYGWYEGVKKAAYNVNSGGATSLADQLYDLATQTTIKMAHCFILPLGFTTASAMNAPDTNTHNIQYGSFKDFKYICQEFALFHLASSTPSGAAAIGKKFVAKKYVLFKDKNAIMFKRFVRKGDDTFRFTPELMNYLKSHPVIASLASAYGSRIMEDYRIVSNHTQGDTTPHISLAAKWAPRASSDLFGPLRTLLHPYVVPESELWKETAANASVAKNNKDIIKKAELKIDTVYRQRLSALNKVLSTVQVKQCNKQWSEIDFDRDVTSVTLTRQKKAFSRDKGLSARVNEVDDDRKKCSDNFKAFMERVRTGTSTAKGKCVSVTDFVKEALKFACSHNPSIVDQKLLIDKQWEDKGKNIASLEDFVAMVDVSGSMECENGYPMNTAIGLGIRIAEKSRLGNRVMTFSETPMWISLEDRPSFTERVAKVKVAPWGMNTNFHGALNLILDAAVKANLTPTDVGKLTLVILSDMQIDQAGSRNEAMFTQIAKEFAETGNRVCGEPYPVPKIVFWNLRQTNGFPTSSSDKNAIMVSGGSDVLLNDICEKGLEAITAINPWNTFVTSLNKARYAILDNTFSDWMV